MVRAVIFLVDGVGQHQCRSAGGIQLVMVMLLHDLDIIVDTQHSRGALAQLCQYIDAHGHIGALEHRNAAGQLHYLQLQLLRKAGGAHHDGQLVGLAVGQCLFHCGRGTEVDDHIALAVQLFQTVVDRNAVLLAVLHINTGRHTAVLPLCDHIAQHMAHAAANTLNHDLCHCCFLISIIWQNARKLKIPGILYAVVIP